MFGNDPVQFGLCVDIPREVTAQGRGGGSGAVHVRAKRQDVEQRFEQAVADFLQQPDTAGIAHEGRAGMAADGGTGERGRNEMRLRPMACLQLGEVHLFVDRPHHHQRAVLADQGAYLFVVRLGSRRAGHSECAGQAQIGFQIIADAAGIGFIRHDGKIRRAKEILRHRPPQIPDRLQRGMLFLRDERFRVQTQQFAQLAQEFCGAVEPDGRLQVRLAQHFGQTAPEFAVHDDVHIGIHQIAHLGQMGAQRHHHVDHAADAFDQTADLVQVRGHVEDPVHRAQDVHARLVTGFALFLDRHPALGLAELGKDPCHCAIGALPLILVDRARQKALDIGALRRDAATDHFGYGPRDHHSRQRGIERFPRPRHRGFGPRGHFILAQPRDHDGQFMRRQRVGVMQHRCHRQVFTPDRAVDDDLQPLDGAEGIDRPPIAPCPIMILHQHQIISSALAALASLSSFF